MSYSPCETPKELIKEIKKVSKDLLQERVTFLYDGKVYLFYPKLLKLKVLGNESSMSLKKFGEKYKTQGLSVLLNNIKYDKSILEAI